MTLVDIQLRPLITRMSASQAKIVASKAVNEAVDDVLGRESLDYADLVTLVSSGDDVSAMKTDIVKINRLKTEIAASVQEKLKEYESRTIKIPLGTLLGVDLLTGRGPKIQLRISLYGDVVTNISSQFEDAGINQTRHQLMCDVKTGIAVIIPGYNSYTEVTTNFSIAETVIVGGVPNSYTNVNGDKSDIVGKINDYTVSE